MKNVWVVWKVKGFLFLVWFLDVIVAEEIGIADEKIDGEGDTIDEDEMDILSASWAQHEDLIPLYCQNTYIDSKNVTIDSAKG